MPTSTSSGVHYVRYASTVASRSLRVGAYTVATYATSIPGIAEHARRRIAEFTGKLYSAVLDSHVVYGGMSSEIWYLVAVLVPSWYRTVSRDCVGP
eukprot:1301341-Rhodomonas_salina.5